MTDPVLQTPIAMSAIGGNYFWIWAIVCASFAPLTYFFGVETSGRTLEQIDQMFFESPRACMGLDKNHSKVIRSTKEDEEMRFKAFATLDKKEEMTVDEIETVSKD